MSKQSNSPVWSPVYIARKMGTKPAGVRRLFRRMELTPIDRHGRAKGYGNAAAVAAMLETELRRFWRVPKKVALEMAKRVVEGPPFEPGDRLGHFGRDWLVQNQKRTPAGHHFIDNPIVPIYDLVDAIVAEIRRRRKAEAVHGTARPGLRYRADTSDEHRLTDDDLHIHVAGAERDAGYDDPRKPLPPDDGVVRKTPSTLRRFDDDE